MTNNIEPDSQEVSSCHKAPVTIGGSGDFDDKDKVITQYYVCSECKQPCDLWQPDSQAGDELDELLRPFRDALFSDDAISDNSDQLVKTEWFKFKKNLRVYAERRATERAIAELVALKQYNGAYIGIGGKRVDHMVHHSVIDGRIAALTTSLKEPDNGDSE